MLVNINIDNLSDGVSEQSPEQRLTSQVAEMLNCVPSPVYGVQRRPPFTWKARILDTLTTDDFFKVINVGEKYFLMVVPKSTTNCLFYHLDKTQGILNTYTSSSAPYFATTNPARDIRTAVVGNTIFVVNRSIPVLPTDTGTETTRKSNIATIYIRQGVFNIEYKVFVENTLVGHVKTTVTSNPTQLNTLEIVDALVNGVPYAGIVPFKFIVNELPLVGTNYTFQTNGNVIQIYRTDNRVFDFRTEDGYADKAMNSFFDKVQLFSDLPPRTFYNNTVVQITGDDKKSNVGFFMKFITDNGQNFGSGTWKETVGWHSQWDNTLPNENLLMNGIDASTMPHLIQYDDTAPQVFDTRVGDWQQRKVGNEISAPFPSFLTEPESWTTAGGVQLGKNRYINNVFFYQNRLGFLSGERVILSKNDDYFDFFPHSASTVSDIDPIDVEVSDNKINILYYAIPYGQTLVLFSDKNQFIYASKINLSPSTVRIDKISSYTMNPLIEPVVNGGMVTFVAPNQQSPKLIQFVIDSNLSNISSVELNSHVPTIIPIDFQEVCVGKDVDFTIVYKRDSKKIPVLKTLTDNNKIVQSAWSHWEFEGDLIFADFVDDILVMLFFYNSFPILGWIELSNKKILECTSYIDDFRFDSFTIQSHFLLEYLYFKQNNSPMVNGRTQLLYCQTFSNTEYTSGFKVRLNKKETTGLTTDYQYSRTTTSQLITHNRFRIPIHTSAENLEIKFFADLADEKFAIHTLNIEGKFNPRTRGM